MGKERECRLAGFKPCQVNTSCRPAVQTTSPAHSSTSAPANADRVSILCVFVRLAGDVPVSHTLLTHISGLLQRTSKGSKWWPAYTDICSRLNRITETLACWNLPWHQRQAAGKLERPNHIWHMSISPSSLSAQVSCKCAAPMSWFSNIQAGLSEAPGHVSLVQTQPTKSA